MSAHGNDAIARSRPDPVDDNGQSHAESWQARSVTHPGTAAHPEQGSPALRGGQPREQVNNGVAALTLRDHV